MAHEKSSRALWLITVVLVLTLLVACGSATTGSATLSPAVPYTPQVPIPGTATQAPSSASATPEPASPTSAGPTSSPATPTSVPPTTMPPSPTVPADTPTASTANPAAAQTTVEVFLIAVGDNGQSGQLVGCGDSAVPVQVAIPATQGVLRAALQALFAIKQQYYGESGLYDALYQSNLQVDSASIESGTAIVNLAGTLTLGGECDNPRVEAQIEQTALQFATVKQVSVFLNGKPLKEVLSLKG